MTANPPKTSGNQEPDMFNIRTLASRRTLIAMALGTLATTAVAAAPADGHTLLFVTSGHAGSGALYSNLRYDPVKAFAPVAKVAATPVVIVAPAAQPWKSLAELMAAARKAPGTLNYAAGGGGATTTA